MQIARKLTVADWEKLRLKLDTNSSENWDTAFDFFSYRIQSRYIEPINTIMRMDLDEGEGFAMVNLQCSLIETIESFHEGWIYAYNGKPQYYHRKVSKKSLRRALNGKRIFQSFFSKRAPFTNFNIKEDFYENVRCALLHETQTKGNWLIRKTATDFKIYECVDGINIIYRNCFQNAIETVIQHYKEKIIDSNDRELKQNFISKFDHICKESTLKSNSNFK